MSPYLLSDRTVLCVLPFCGTISGEKKGGGGVKKTFKIKTKKVFTGDFSKKLIVYIWRKFSFTPRPKAI